MSKDFVDPEIRGVHFSVLIWGEVIIPRSWVQAHVYGAMSKGKDECVPDRVTLFGPFVWVFAVITDLVSIGMGMHSPPIVKSLGAVISPARLAVFTRILSSIVKRFAGLTYPVSFFGKDGFS